MSNKLSKLAPKLVGKINPGCIKKGHNIIDLSSCMLIGLRWLGRMGR